MNPLERRLLVLTGAAAGLLSTYLLTAEARAAEPFMPQVRQEALQKARSFTAQTKAAKQAYDSTIARLKPQFDAWNKVRQEAYLDFMALLPRMEDLPKDSPAYRQLEGRLTQAQKKYKDATAQMEQLEAQADALQAKAVEPATRQVLAAAAYGMVLHADKDDNQQLDAEERQMLLRALGLSGTFEEATVKTRLLTLDGTTLAKAIQFLNAQNYPFTPRDKTEWDALFQDLREAAPR